MIASTNKTKEKKMLTSTSFDHPETQRKIFVAMQQTRIQSLKNSCSGCAYVLNSQGEAFLRVEHFRGGQGFKFTNENEIITQKVLTSLRKNSKIELQIK